MFPLGSHLEVLPAGATEWNNPWPLAPDSESESVIDVDGEELSQDEDAPSASEDEPDLTSHKSTRRKWLRKFCSDYDGHLAGYNRRTARKGGPTHRLRRNTYNELGIGSRRPDTCWSRG